VRKVRLIDNDKKEKARTLNVKIFCLFKELFNLKEFVDLKRLCLEEKFNFEKIVNKLI
jgi:hypothetical protein